MNIFQNQNLQLNWSNYTIKADLESATIVGRSNVAKKPDLSD